MRSMVVAVGALTLLAGCRSSATTPVSKEVLMLIVKLEDPEPTIKAQAAKSLSRHGAAAAPAVPALIRAMNSPDYEVRLYTSEALGKVGPAARPAMNVLIRALSDSEYMIRKNAAIALGEIADIKAVTYLDKVAKEDEIGSVRTAARESINKLKH